MSGIIIANLLFPLFKYPDHQNAINAFGVLWTVPYLLTEF